MRATIRGVVMTFHSDLVRNRLLIELMTGDGVLVAEATGDLATTIIAQLYAVRARRELAIVRCTGSREPSGTLRLTTLTLEGA